MVAFFWWGNLCENLRQVSSSYPGQAPSTSKVNETVHEFILECYDKNQMGTSGWAHASTDIPERHWHIQCALMDLLVNMDVIQWSSFPSMNGMLKSQWSQCEYPMSIIYYRPSLWGYISHYFHPERASIVHLEMKMLPLPNKPNK